jgi:hypothetical protein
VNVKKNLLDFDLTVHLIRERRTICRLAEGFLENIHVEILKGGGERIQNCLHFSPSYLKTNP